MTAPIKPRRILTGGAGQMMPLRPRTVIEQVEDYLMRLTCSVPFPCTPEQAYFGCVPDVIEQWYGNGGETGLWLTAGREPGKLSNLMASTHVARANVRDQSNIVHVSTDPKESYVHAIRGTGGFESIFWLEAPPHSPIPRDSVQKPFFLPLEHPFHDAINEWVRQAYVVEDEIQASLVIMKKFVAIAKTPTQVSVTWPELLNFVNLSGERQGLSKQVSHTLRKEIDAAVPSALRSGVIDQLTSAVMLPANRPLKAWVKFYSKRFVP